MKRTLIAPVIGLAMLTPALADAATSPNTTAREPVRLTQQLFQYTVSGAPPTTGSTSYVGTSDGRIGAASVHATTRGTNTYRNGNFSGRGTIFAPGGSIRLSFTATMVFDGRFAGRGRFTGGTGQYRGSRGLFRFTTSQESQTTFLRTLTGWINLR